MFPDRISRVESMLMSEISQALTHYQDTLRGFMGGALLTITRVVVTKNLEQAAVYYSWLNLPKDKTPQDFEAVLKEIAPQITHDLRRRVVLKRFPKVVFRYDLSLAGASRIYEILESLREPKEPRRRRKDDGE